MKLLFICSQCNIVFQRIIPGRDSKSPSAQVSVNHIRFNGTRALMNIVTNTTHEWLITSNFHQFHQHIWPYQIQSEGIVDGWLGQKGMYSTK